MTDTVEGWAIVELMGHLRRAGRISEIESFGTRLLRLEVPIGADEFATELYGGGSIYRIRMATEEVARAVAERIGDPRPLKPVTYRLEAREDHDVRDVEFDEMAD
jgi:fatty acid-binding protein DegV